MAAEGGCLYLPMWQVLQSRVRVLRTYPSLRGPQGMMPSEGGDGGYKSSMPPLERLTQLTSSSAVKARSKVKRAGHS